MIRVKKIILAMMCTIIMAIGSICSAAAFTDKIATDMNGNNVIRVIGIGVAPQGSQFSATQKKMMARQAAIVHGYGELAAAVKGVHVNAEDTVENFVLKNSTVSTKVSAVINGAKVVEERQEEDGYIVVMEIPMYGNNSVASAVIPEVTPQAPPATAPVPKTQVTPTGGYTGVVIDCRSLDVAPAICPCVYSEDGRRIYGYQISDSKTLIEKGAANYVKDMSLAYRRAGNNPIVVKAIRVENNRINPIISDDDADRILAENGYLHFLESGNVTILR